MRRLHLLLLRSPLVSLLDSNQALSFFIPSMELFSLGTPGTLLHGNHSSLERPDSKVNGRFRRYSLTRRPVRQRRLGR
ncbi:hypothetical protein BKA70DRAFT_1306967 [Coprinopsis sp. MPI-PUGE-AT-0042]|nr:hypothetical protein BKA70DRAFT_1306967 [Coprinopsis sp. MPI-PUGE-AT-0042]